MALRSALQRKRDRFPRGRSNELAVFDVATRKELKRLRTGGFPVGIVIEPDGTWAFVAYTADSTIAIYDLQTLEVVDKIAAGKQALPRPKWKPRRACICMPGAIWERR